MLWDQMANNSVEQVLMFSLNPGAMLYFHAKVAPTLSVDLRDGDLKLLSLFQIADNYARVVHVKK